MSRLKIPTTGAPGPRLGRGDGTAGPSRSLGSLHRPAHACGTRVLPQDTCLCLLDTQVCPPQTRGNVMGWCEPDQGAAARGDPGLAPNCGSELHDGAPRSGPASPARPSPELGRDLRAKPRIALVERKRHPGANARVVSSPPGGGGPGTAIPSLTSPQSSAGGYWVTFWGPPGAMSHPLPAPSTQPGLGDAGWGPAQLQRRNSPSAAPHPCRAPRTCPGHQHRQLAELWW